MRHTRDILALVSLLVLVAFVSSMPADAGTCDITEFPSTGLLTSERLNQRLRQVEGCINGNIGDENITDVAASKVSPNDNYELVAVDIACATGSDVYAFKLPYEATLTGLSARGAGCSGSCNLTVTLQADAVTVASASSITTASTVVTSFAGSTAASTSTVVNLDVSGTTTGCTSLNVVIGLRAELQ